jgi:hypothetical protein
MTRAGIAGRVGSWPRGLFVVVAASLALVVSAWFFPPRVQFWDRRDPRLQEWSRADAFLKQCQDPLRQDVEPAVRWRLLPPVVCHALRLPGFTPLAFCWLGLAAFAAALAGRLDALGGSRAWAALGTLLFATSGPFITALGWLGINDGWYLLALLESTACRSCWALAAWAFLGPWIDERYLIALPLALLVRMRIAAGGYGQWRRTCAAACAGVAPYILLRAGVTLVRGDAVSSGYVASMLGVFRIYAAYLPLGWAMGYRVGWLALAAGFLSAGRGLRAAWTALAAATLLAVSVLAWDIDRSTGVLLPVYVAGVAAAARAAASGRPRLLALGLACVAVNLLLPYAHVVGFTLSWNRGPFGIWRSLSG